MVFDFISWQGNTEVIGDLYGDMIAGWEFGASSGSIGTDLKGVHNATAYTGLSKTSSNQPLGDSTLKWDGTNGYHCRIPYNAALSHVNVSFTYACLFYPSDSAVNSYNQVHIFSKDMYQSAARTVTIGLFGQPSANDFVAAFLVGNGASTYSIPYHPVTNFNQWNLLICEYKYDLSLSNTKQSIYLNNALVSEVQPSFFIGDNILDFCLAGRYNSTNIPASADTFSGSNLHQLAYVYRWNRLLNSAEKSYLFNGGNFRYVRP